MLSIKVQECHGLDIEPLKLYPSPNPAESLIALRLPATHLPNDGNW